MTILIILAVVALLALWVISIQRSLVSEDEKCQNAMSQIGVQQSSRWDALTALAELTKSYNEHEYNALRDIIAARSGISRNSTAAEADAQEDMLNQVISRINVVAEQYPELKANENYAKTMDSVNVYENQVRMSRMVYNDSVTIYNRKVRSFPDSIVASMLHFDTKDYLKVEAQKTAMPSMKI